MIGEAGSGPVPPQAGGATSIRQGEKVLDSYPFPFSARTPPIVFNVGEAGSGLVPPQAGGATSIRQAAERYNGLVVSKSICIEGRRCD